MNKRIQSTLLAIGVAASWAVISPKPTPADEGQPATTAGKAESVRLSPGAVDRSGLKVLVAGPTSIAPTLTLSGKLVPQEDRVARITPRFPGVVRELRRRTGQSIGRGEVVAVVENNQTLQPYEVKSPIAGVVVQRRATVGESVTDVSVLAEVGDYIELFADLYVFPTEFAKVRVGQSVTVRFPDDSPNVESAITFLSPVADADTQSRYARAVLPNADGAHQPGTFVTGEVSLGPTAVGVAVDVSAVRSNDGTPIVFVETAVGNFQARPVHVGRRDRERIEVVSGLSAGERYAAGNTLLLLAELGKGEIEHEE
jgi:multidrug efflux pump subunit AcrA (membrane-fusion protein)